MMNLYIFDNGDGAYGKGVIFHIDYEDGTRCYRGREVFYGYSWREIVNKIRERARELTGKRNFHTTCYR